VYAFTVENIGISARTIPVCRMKVKNLSFRSRFKTQTFASEKHMITCNVAENLKNVIKCKIYLVSALQIRVTS